MMESSERELRRYRTFLGRAPSGRIPFWESFSNPDAETFITGIDYYDHPRLCRLKMQALYPELGLAVFPTDAPKPRPKIGADGAPATNTEAHTARWGDSETATWEHGEKYFKTEEDVFAFDPLAHADMRDWPHVVMNFDYRDEETLYQTMLKWYPVLQDNAPPGQDATAWFYNTTFMWPLLTFGWELFMVCCLDERFEPVMDGFAELNRRAFRALCRLPVDFLVCHDDIATTRGPVCSRQWMYKYVYPRYEEYFAMAKAAGKTVIFMADGCVNDMIDDCIACGAKGLISEPVTDYRGIVRRHPDIFVAGEGDNRILSSGDKGAIKKMVLQMVETAKMSGGYMMCIGNHIPWNVPPESVKYYLDLCDELAYR
jgi:hypothetical protein